jgi:hypothetical protein
VECDALRALDVQRHAHAQPQPLVVGQRHRPARRQQPERAETSRGVPAGQVGGEVEKVVLEPGSHVRTVGVADLIKVDADVETGRRAGATPVARLASLRRCVAAATMTAGAP